MENILNSLLPNDLKKAYEKQDRENKELGAYREFFAKLGKNFDEISVEEARTVLEASVPRQDIGAQPVQSGWREDTATIANEAYKAVTAKNLTSKDMNKVDKLQSKLMRQYADVLGIQSDFRGDADVLNRIKANG